MILPRREFWVFVVCLVFRVCWHPPLTILESESLQALETWHFQQWILIKDKYLQKKLKTQVCQHLLLL